jgi:cholesterol transport system auxiliary component
MKTFKPIRNGLTAVLVAMLLPACMLTGQQAPISIMAPNVDVLPDDHWPVVEWSLQVQRPIADQMRDSDRVLVRRTPSRLQVYSQAAWLDSVPEMLQSVMIKGFADAGVFGGVGRAGGIRTRYSLTTEIRNFEAVDDGGPDLRVEVVLQAGLIHQRSARPVAGQIFRHSGQARGKGVDALIEAYELVLQELLVELTEWVLEEGLAFDSMVEELGEQSRRPWRQR